MSGMIQGVLLAGGASRRMGREKALLETAEGPLWRRQWALLEAVGGARPWVAAPARPGWLPPELEWVPDVAAAGPLGGVVAALQRAGSGRVLILAVDLPRMNEACLRQLVSLSEAGRGVIPHGPRGWEPLAAIYPAEVAEAGQARLVQGDFALWAWAEALEGEGRIRRWEIPEAFQDCFLNVNTPEDWGRVEG